MKKYFFILSICAIFATVACDTSSKGTTTQMAAAPQSQPTSTEAAAPKADTAVGSQQMKAMRSTKAKSLEMAAPQKMAAEPSPIKQQ